MNRLEIKNYLDNISKSGIRPGLETIRELLRRLGNPQDKLKCVHVAGTNGKGSTISYIACILNEAGYRTGAYTSPCVFSEYEKFAVSGIQISPDKYEELMTEVIVKCTEMTGEGFVHPTVFEMETGAAFYYFYREGCDYAVIETGMGGRDDATNVIENTEVEVLTSIAMDHMKFLGNTIEEIAFAKGGIIKPGSDVVLYDQDERVSRIISGICTEKNAGLSLCNVSDAEASAYYDEEKQALVFSYGNFEKLETVMPGMYQASNAAVAVEAALLLRKRGAGISDMDIRKGIKKASIGGRFEIIHKKPLIIIDGAHNPDAALKLVRTVKMYFTNRRLLYIMGVLADKDFGQTVKLTVPVADKVYTITPENSRALDAEKLAACVSEYCSDVEAKHSLEGAVKDAMLWAGDDGVIIAFGSLSYLGAVKEIVKEMQS